MATRIEDVRFLNRLDTKSNWNSRNAELLPGEIGILTDSNGKIIGLCAGGTIESEETTGREIITADKIFYPGAGSGYVLPDATFETKGGVKPSQDYYTDPDSLTIKGLT